MTEHSRPRLAVISSRPMVCSRSMLISLPGRWDFRPVCKQSRSDTLRQPWTETPFTPVRELSTVDWGQTARKRFLRLRFDRDRAAVHLDLLCLCGYLYTESASARSRAIA